MITIDVWRARIRSFQAAGSCSCCVSVTLHLSKCLMYVAVLHYLVTFVLLVIGNVEPNPGPGFTCSECSCAFDTLNLHAHHQRLHSVLPSFMFECGECKQQFSSFTNLTSHISRIHKDLRKASASNPDVVFHISCPHCTDERFLTVGDFCHHLLSEHVGKSDTSVVCPLQEDCKREETFSSKSAFSAHLSRCHPEWRTKPPAVPIVTLAGENASGSGVHHSFRVDSYQDSNFGGNEINSDNSTEDEEQYFDAESSFTEDDIFTFLTTFYLMLEVDCLLPVTTIDRISESLTFITEAVHSSMKTVILKELLSHGISNEDIRHILSKLPSADPLYLAHHKHTRGPDLTTDYLRKKEFLKQFPQIPVDYPNFVKKDPIDGERYALVSIRKSLTNLFEDASIQKEVSASFLRNAQSINSCDARGFTIYKDFTDGEVSQKRNLPAKRIDLFIFQDSFNSTSMITNVQDRFRILGMYFTLGNLSPWQRTKLKAMHLVMLIFEKHVKKHRQKSFEKLKEELKDLETNGIEFMGETIPVFVQFFIGDNLGSHFLGGFVEGFTATHFCRYCEISKAEFKSNPVGVKTLRTQASYHCSVLRKLSKNLLHHRGVKENSVFNQLQKFKVCDPGLPPCLGHDLFHGVADWDLRNIIVALVDKNWFSLELLNRRVSSFKYHPNDLKNKPAPIKVPKTGKKGKKSLGGSAVQNWLLLRLLPIIMHDKIRDTNDPHWKLCLMLRKICELVCAPTISSVQVNELDQLIDRYLRQRKILGPAKPKHHFLRHYPELIRKCGPLIHLWAMRFEQKHRFFKKVARTCNNFINLLVTLANKSQLLFVYEGLGPRFRSVLTDSKFFPVSEESFKHDVFWAVKSQNFSSEAKATKQIKVDGLMYRTKEYVVLKNEDMNLRVGCIEAVVVDGNKVFLVLRNQKAIFDSKLGIYQISTLTSNLFVVEQKDLENPCTQPVYCLDGADCFTLKHSVL